MLSIYQVVWADQAVAVHRAGMRQRSSSTWAANPWAPQATRPLNCTDAGTDSFPPSACGASVGLCTSVPLVQQACQLTCKLCNGHTPLVEPSSPSSGGAGAAAGGQADSAAEHGAMMDASDLAAEQALVNERLEREAEHNKTLARLAAKRAEREAEEKAKEDKLMAIRQAAEKAAAAEVKAAAARAEAKRRRRARSYVPMYAGDEDELCYDGTPRAEHHDAATLAQIALASDQPFLVHSFFATGVISQVRFIHFVVEEALVMGAVAVVPLWVAAQDGARGGDAMRVGRLDELWRMRNYVERLHCFCGVLAVLPTDVGLELRAGSSGAPQDSRLDLDALRARVGDGRLFERSEAPLGIASRAARNTIIEQLERGSAAQHARPSFYGPPLARGQTGEDWMQRMRAAHEYALLPSEPLATRFGRALGALAQHAQLGSGAQFSRTQFAAVQATRTDHTAGEIHTCRPEDVAASSDSASGGTVERILSAIDVGVSAGDRASTVMYVASVGRAALPRLARRGWQPGKTAFTLEMLLPAAGQPSASAGPTGRRLLAWGEGDGQAHAEEATAASAASATSPPPASATGTDPAMPPAAADAAAAAAAVADAPHSSTTAPPATQQTSGGPGEGKGKAAAASSAKNASRVAPPNATRSATRNAGNASVASTAAPCADRSIPKAWPLNTCEKQLVQGKCDKPHNKYPGGFCPLTCGHCGQLKSADAASVTDESVVGPDHVWLDEAVDLLLQTAADTLVGNSECEVLHYVALMRCRVQTAGGLLRLPGHAPHAMRSWLAANASNTSIAGLGYGIRRETSGVLVYNRDKVKGLGCPHKLI